MPAFYGTGSITEVAAGTITLPLPAGAPTNSVAIAMVLMRAGGFITMPAGWTAIHSTNTGNNSTTINTSRSSVLIAWAPVSGGLSTTFNAAGGRTQGVIAVYTDVDTTTPYSAMNMSTEAMVQRSSHTGVDAVVGQMLVTFGFNSHRSSPNTSTDWNTTDGLSPSPANWTNPVWNPRVRNQSPNNPRSTIALGDIDVPQSGPSGTIVFNFPPFSPPANPYNQIVTIALQSPSVGPITEDTGSFFAAF